MHEVRVPYANQQVFSPRNIGRSYNRLEVNEDTLMWLAEHCPNGQWVQTHYGSWQDSLGLPIEVYLQRSGLVFEFQDPQTAMLFKLTFV